MTRWALACSETLAFLMPKFLGHFAGLSLQTELLVINIFGLINSTLDWSYLTWNHQVEKIWNLSLAEQDYASEGAVIYWIKSVLSWIVIVRIVIAHLYTLSYAANMYSIVTWSRPRYLLPWIAISFFKNIILEIIVMVLCFILWFEDKITTPMLVEFAIVKGVSLSVAVYNWWITCYGFLEIKRSQTAELIRRFTLQYAFLYDKSDRLCRSFDDAYRFSILRPYHRHHPSMPNLDDFSISTPLENDLDEIRLSVSLTTLLTNTSWISDDADLTPKERCMKALDLTEEDILRARNTVREPLSFLSLEIIDQMSIRLERDPDVEKDLIYFLVRDCKLESAEELKAEKPVVPTNEKKTVANKAAIEKEEISIAPAEAKVTDKKLEEADTDVPTTESPILVGKDGKDVNAETKSVGEEKEEKVEKTREAMVIEKQDEKSPKDEIPSLPIEKETKEEKLFLKDELVTKSVARPSLPVPEKKIQEKLLPQVQVPPTSVASPCLPFVKENTFNFEPSTLSDTHPCLPFIRERRQQTCDPAQTSGKCFTTEVPNNRKVPNVRKNNIEVEKMVKQETFLCQCASPGGDRKNEKEPMLKKPEARNDCRMSDTVTMANENFQSLLQAFKKAKGNEPPARNAAMIVQLSYQDSSGDSCNPSVLEPFLTHDESLSKLIQRSDPIPPSIPLNMAISSRTLYSGLAYASVPKFSIAGGMWFRDHSSIVPKYFEPPLTTMFEGYENIFLNNYRVYNTVHRVGLANAVGILKPNPKLAESSERQQIAGYQGGEMRDFVHSTQSFDLMSHDDSASTSVTLDSVEQVRLTNLRSSDAQTENWSRLDVIESLKSMMGLSDDRSKNISTQTNSSLWKVSRTKTRDVTETKKEVWAREGNRYREDTTNNGGTGITSRNSVGNFHQANRIHSQSTSKSVRYSSQSRFSGKTSPMSGTHSRISLTDEIKQSVILKRYLRDNVAQTQASLLHEYLLRRYDQSHWKKLERPRPGSWGTATLAQAAHRSGYQGPILQGKPPTYPKFMQDQEMRLFASSSNDWRMMRSVASRSSSFGRRPVSVRDKRSAERQPAHNSHCSRSRKHAEPVENSESREIRALKAYNKFTLLEDKREMDAKRRDFIMTSKKEKLASAVHRVQNESSNDSSVGRNSVNNLEVKAVVENRSVLQENTSRNDEDNKNASKILKSLGSKEAQMILELLDHFGGKQLRRELRKMLEANQVDSAERYSKHSVPEKVTENQNESTISSQRLKGARKDRDLEKVQVKQVVKEDVDILTAVNSGRSQENHPTDGINVDTVKSFVWPNEDSASSFPSSLTNERIDNREETVQKSPISSESVKSNAQSSKLEETADEREVEIIPSSKVASPALRNKSDATLSQDSQPYQRIVVVESESTNSMESIRSDGETWVLEERLDERLLGNAFQLGSREANMMDLFDIVRGIGLDFNLPRVVTNAQMQGRSLNINDLRKSTQAHIVDDTTASMLHNAFYFRPEIIVRTIQDVSSFGSDSQTDSDDVFSAINDIFSVHRLRSRPDDFVCYANNSDINESGYRHLENQQSSVDDEDESTFSLCLILDQDDLSDATEQSSATLSAETVQRQIEYQNSLDNISSCRLDFQYVGQFQEETPNNLRITELDKSADDAEEAVEIQHGSYDDSNSNIEALRQKLMREFFRENEEYINRLNVPIKCDISDIIPPLDDYYKRNWQIEPFTKIPKCCVLTTNEDILSKNELSEEPDKTEMIGAGASQFNKLPSALTPATIFMPSTSKNKFLENSPSTDDIFPPDDDIPQSASWPQIETIENKLIDMKHRVENEEKTVSLEGRESLDSKGAEIEPKSSKIQEPQPSGKLFSFVTDDVELLPLSIIFAFCQLIILLYIQFFFATLFPNEKASKSTLTSCPYEAHSVYTSTTRLFDPPSVRSLIYQRSSSRHFMKLTSDNSISTINENASVWPPADERIIKIIEPLSATEIFPEVTKKEIVSLISDILNDIVKCMDCSPKLSPTNSETQNAKRHSSVFFEPQKSFYLLNADTDVSPSEIITAGNQLPKRKIVKKSESPVDARLQDESTSSTAAANTVLNEQPAESETQKQPLDVTSSGFQYTDSFNSTFTRVNESSRSEVSLGGLSTMEEFSRDASFASASQSINEPSESESIDEEAEKETKS